MPFNTNNFIKQISPGDRNLQILDDTGTIRFTINPYSVINILQNNNLLKINLKSGKFKTLDFRSNFESIQAVTILQRSIDQMVVVDPFTIDKEIENYVQEQIQQSGGGGDTAKPFYQTGTPNNTSGDNQPTGLTLTKKPTGFSRIQVLVNGQSLLVGITSNSVDCYFSPDGVVVRNYENMEVGDELYFNGDFVGYDLSTTDEVVFMYESKD